MTLLLWIIAGPGDQGRALPERGGVPSRSRGDVCAGAGLAGGLATSTKYNAAAVAVAMAATQLVWFSAAAVVWYSRGERGCRRWRSRAAFAVGFLAGTPYAVLDYPKFSEDLRYDFTHLSGGHLDINLGRGWIYHATHSLPYGAGIATCAAALVGLVPFARRHGRAAVVIGSFGPLLLRGRQRLTVFFRYVLPLIPLICLSPRWAWTLGEVAGAPHSTRRWPCARTRRRSRHRPGLVYAVWFDVLLARTDTRVLAGEWLTPRLSPGATLHRCGWPLHPSRPVACEGNPRRVRRGRQRISRRPASRVVGSALVAARDLRVDAARARAAGARALRPRLPGAGQVAGQVRRLR